MFKGLLARTLLILLAPLVLVQIILIYLVFDRHLERVTHTAAEDISAQVAVILDMYEKKQESMLWASQRMMNITVTEKPPQTITTHFAHNFLSSTLGRALESKISRPFVLNVSSRTIDIAVSEPDHLVLLSMPTKKLFSRTTRLIVIWSTISAVLFFIIAAIFMRNQITPLRRLADAFDRFGKTQEDFAFIPQGAYEVKKAGIAFNLMKSRLTKALGERVEALASFSHDLRTPLSRMKFAIAMVEGDPKYIKQLKDDVRALEEMTSVYLDFAKFSLLEEAHEEDLNHIIQTVIGRFSGFPITFKHAGNAQAYVRTKVIERVFENVIKNSQQYAKHLTIHTSRKDDTILIIFDDDGPGIPQAMRGEVFKPFFRADQSRKNSGKNVGLGLSIVRDGVINHGGKVTLEDSPMGGLRLIIALPSL